MTNAEILRSILRGIQAGRSYQMWMVGACVEFRVFQPVIEKSLLKFIGECKGRSEGMAILSIIYSMKGLPHTMKPVPKSPILAGKFNGKLTDFNGRPVPGDKKVKMGKVSPLSRFSGIQQGKADKKYVVSCRKK